MTDGGRLYGGASAAERRAARRERLIRAAIGVYGDLGYRQTTIGAICKAAGLTPRYFYEAFEGSEALLGAAFEAVTEVVIAAIVAEGARSGGAPDARLRAMLTRYYTVLRDEPAAARVFLIEIAGVSPAIDALFAASIDRFADLITRTLVPEHCAADVTDRLLRTGATYGLLHVARAWIGGGYREPIPQVVDAAMPLCILLAKRQGGGA